MPAPDAARMPDAAQVLRQHLVGLMDEMTLQRAIRKMLDDHLIEVGDRLWVDVPYGMGRAKPL